MPLPSDALTALTNELDTRLVNTTVVSDANISPGPASGPVLYVRHSRDVVSPQQWTRQVASEFTLVYYDAQDAAALVQAFYSQPRTLLVGTDSYDIQLATSIDRPYMWPNGNPVPSTVQTFHVAYLLSSIATVEPSGGGSLVISAGEEQRMHSFTED